MYRIKSLYDNNYAQFLCVMNGGLLVQHVSNHALWETHEIYELDTSKSYDITSTHHQMQYPFNLNSNDYDLLFCSANRLSKYYEGEGIDKEMIQFEPEVVLYHKDKYPKCLAIQGHPEYMRSESPIIIRLNQIINNLLKY